MRTEFDGQAEGNQGAGSDGDAEVLYPIGRIQPSRAFGLPNSRAVLNGPVSRELGKVVTRPTYRGS